MMPRANSLQGKTLHTPFTHRVAEFDAKLSVYSNAATFCLAYGLTNVVLFTFGAAGEFARWPNDALRAYGIGIARGFGYCINFNVALTLILATRSLMTLLRGTALNAIIPFDKAMPLFHAFVGYATLVCAIGHGVFHSVGFARNMWALGGFLGWRYCVSTGIPLLAIFCGIVTFAYKPNRDSNFERFMGSHLIGATLFLGLLAFHGVYLGKLYTYKWILGPLALYIADRIYRKIVENNGTVSIRRNGRACLPNGITRIELPRIFNFQAGQYAELKVPTISAHEWHPFTIASAPHEPTLVFYIKCVGDEAKSWTNQLHNMLKVDSCAISTVSDLGDVEIHCRGPYGAPAQHHGQYDRAVLISGGVGSTPFLSIAKHVDHIIRGYDLCSLQDRERDSEATGTNTIKQSRGEDSDHSSDRGFSDEGEDDMNIVGIHAIGMSRDVGGGAVKNRTKVAPKAGNNAGTPLKRRATVKRVQSHDLEAGPATETWLEFLINFSHSAVGNTSLLWLMLMRFAGNLMLVAVKDASMSRQGTQLFRHPAATGLDFVLGALIGSILISQVFLEIANSSLDLIDLLLLLPLNCIQPAVHILFFCGVLHDQGHFTFNLIALVWPLGFACFLFRYFRIVGRRIALVDTVNASHRTLRSLDFVWTTPKASDDDWLCSDLASSIAASRHSRETGTVRLHRFITRELPPDIEAGESIAAIPGFKNNFGRPCWDQLFTALVNNSPNGATIGVFVCGPAGLTAAVKTSALRAMIESRWRTMKYRGQRSKPTREVESRSEEGHSFESDQVSAYRRPGGATEVPRGNEVQDWTRSFNVRFIVREENF